MKKIVNFHNHSHFSNMGMMEVVSKPSDYVQWALDNGSPAVAFTEHGNVLSWVSKKKAVNGAGLKYIHGIETYITDSLDEKLRDNNHLILIAKNYDGVREINTLSSKAYEGRGNKKPGEVSNFHYNPRITFADIQGTSDNVIILTACLGSPLYQSYKNKENVKLKKWMDFLRENKHRVWLEVQPHLHPEQKIYNKFLIEMANRWDMNLIASNDVHAHSKESDRLRKLLMEAKGINFDDDLESSFDIWAKNYDEMVESFKEQGVLTDDQIETALDNTIVLADMIEDFELDYSIKYPHLFENPISRLKGQIVKGFRYRKVDQMEPHIQTIYKARVNKELADYMTTDSDSYLLIEDYIKEEMRKEDRYPGYGRGSVTGSLIAFLLQITDVDPIIEGLSFERFINKDRVSLPDVDSDWGGEDRARVQEFLLTHPQLNCTAIITYNTLAERGAIKEIGRAMGYDSSEVGIINKSLIEEGGKTIIPKFIEEKYPELIANALAVIGTISSVGRHAAGIVVTDRKSNEDFGTIKVADFPYPVSAIDMKEIDSLNYVKLDVLGLDNIKLINNTCKLAELPLANPQSDYIDFQDEKVWKSMTEDNVGIFQFDATDRAGKILKEVFSDATLTKIKERLGDDIKYIDLLSLANASQRPSGASYIESVVEGKFKENGHAALDDLLKDTMGNLVYQEQQIKFLTDFCGYTPSSADSVRRAIGKKQKEVLENEVPKIRESFIETMIETHKDTPEHAELIADSFMQVFLDSANYSFSKNHSVPYSYIGYISAWLRYYYPLEFVTAGLEIWKDKQDKTNKLIAYAERKGIKLDTPKFRYSKGEYFFDKETNTIYQGTAPIKDNNAEVGNLLYKLRNDKYNSFTELLLSIREKSTITIDGVAHQLHDVFENWNENQVKELDKDIKALEPKDAFNPYQDKKLIEKFEKWAESQSEVSETLAELGVVNGGYKYTDEDVKPFFDCWKDEVYKGKKKWLEESEPVKDIVIEKETLPINKTKMISLIRMNFFSEFGGNKKLAEIYDLFNEQYKPKSKTFKSKQAKYLAAKELEDKLPDESFSIIEQCEFELYYTGRVTSKNESIPPKYAFVTEVTKIGKSRTSAIVFIINKGVSTPIKVKSNTYRNVPFQLGDLVEVQETKLKAKMQKVGGEWIKSETDKEIWVEQMKFIRKSSMETK